jgi:hypothetical protein
MFFSYNIFSRGLLELDCFDQITLFLRVVAWPANKNKYENYNLLESYDPGKKGALM